MLTAKQIKELPKGDYPNWMLVKMFPKQQGIGKSAKMTTVKESHGGKENIVKRLINQFTGKVVRQRKK